MQLQKISTFQLNEDFIKTLILFLTKTKFLEKILFWLKVNCTIKIFINKNPRKVEQNRNTQ